MDKNPAMQKPLTNHIISKDKEGEKKMPAEWTERTAFNNGTLSERFRRWGLYRNETDIGFLTFEHEEGKIFALIEYKKAHALKQYASHMIYRALIDMGNRAWLPVIVCRYSDDFSRYSVIPLNAEARKIIPNRTEYDELGWVKELYRMRGREVPDDVLSGMNVEI